MAFLHHIHTVPCHLKRDLFTTKDLDPRLNICKMLLHPTHRRVIGCASVLADPFSVDLLCKALLVMLQVVTEAFGAESSSG